MSELEIFEKVISFLEQHNLQDKIMIAGSWAYYIYKNYYFKSELSPVALRTMDIDLYIPHDFKKKLHQHPPLDMKTEMEKLGFKEKKAQSPQGIYTQFYHQDFKLEFITEQTNNTSYGKGVLVYGLGITVNPIKNLEMINFPMPVKISDTLTLFVPEPEYFALHKIYIAEKRTYEPKKQKDWSQAIDLLSLLKISKIKKAFVSLNKSVKKDIIENLKIKKLDEYIELLTKQ